MGLHKLVRIALAVQKHQLPTAMQAALYDEFEDALRGFSDGEVEDAFRSWMSLMSEMPKPSDIVYVVAFRRGIIPLLSIGVH